MATTKIKAIKNTLYKAIQYIINPEKTEGALLVSSYGCSVEFADLEMQATATKGSGLGNRVAYHFIQSFSPDDELTPEQAHEIGEKFADGYLKGKYEYVIATHVDKGHVHNHIIFNATSYTSLKKYRYSGEAERDKIRAISDELCRENGLSIIENQRGRRGWKRGDKQKNQKQKLMDIIDEAVKDVSSFEDFLTVMELEYHYDIKKRGQMISLKSEDGERYIRLKGSTLGENYTEEMIRKRIENPKCIPKPKINKPYKRKQPVPDKKKINLLVDISKNAKAQASKGYSVVLQRSNTENLIRTMNFLIEKDIVTPEDFSEFMQNKKQEYAEKREKIESLETELHKLLEKIKYTKVYLDNRPVYKEYKKAEDKRDFLAKYAKEMALFKASYIYFDQKKLNPAKINYWDLIKDKKKLYSQISEADVELKKIRSDLKEYSVIQKNIETVLGIEFPSADLKRDNTIFEENRNVEKNEIEK